jgi:hypothetical protein
MPKFKFDAGITVDSPLTYSFARNVATLDPLGGSVAAHTPRFDGAVLLSSVEDWARFDAVVGGNSSLWDTGFDFDGVGQLALVGYFNGFLRIYYNGTSSYYDLNAPADYPLSPKSWPPDGGKHVGAF